MANGLLDTVSTPKRSTVPALGVKSRVLAYVFSAYCIRPLVTPAESRIFAASCIL